MDLKINKITDVMKKAEELVEKEIKKAPEDTVLIASALMAVTRNLYVSALGIEGTAHMFEAVADSFVETEEFIQQFKPTIH
jgi:hypothetical protein|tara:strand:+ start:69 stop:311 length:243 start_codon:yes stop_codon:yes gene_type:complete